MCPASHGVHFLLQINGDITYNGKSFDQFVVERSAGYVEQTDQHYAALTVRETFDFAASCQGSGYHRGMYTCCLSSKTAKACLCFTLFYDYSCMSS